MRRRDFVGGGTLALTGLGAVEKGIASPTPQATPEEIYKLLGFATMSGEDPLKLWARLRETKQWLAGPLAPDGWAGQAFVADHGDIFGFRFLSLPASWMKDIADGKKAAYVAPRFNSWFGGQAWRTWWRTIGPRAADDSYARLVWQMPDGGPEVTYEWARTAANEVVCRITNSHPADIAIQAYVPWDVDPPKFSVLYADGPDKKFVRGRSWVPKTRDGMRWVLAANQPVTESFRSGSPLWHGYIPQVSVLLISARQGQQYDALEEQTSKWIAGDRIPRLLEENRSRYLSQRPSGSGWLAEAPAAVNDVLQWSEVYTPTRRRRYITVSRSWAFDLNSAPDFLWDSFLNAVLVCQEDERKAFEMMDDITSWQSDSGMLVQYGQWISRPKPLTSTVAWGHSQYPIGALAAAKIYLRRPDRKFLARIYPRLLKFHKWWFSDRGDGQPWRDGNRNGLLELGSNYPEEIGYANRQQVAYYESYDDSPQWWGVAKYNEKTQTLEQDTVERNCLYAMDCWLLAWIAETLGDRREAAALRAEHARMKETINRLLWDPARNCYLNRRWAPMEGDCFFPQVSPDIFFALLGQVADVPRANHLRTLFNDPKKFAGEWLLPTISRDDPSYPKQDYWKGKVWAPVNWLVFQGIKMAEWDREARLLAESGMKMFMKPWRKSGNCHENFLATTGEGSSDPHYTWGALMPLIGIEELIDVNPWHGLRFGNLDPVEDAAIERYQVAGASYDVFLSRAGLRVQRNGRPLFETDHPVEIRHVAFDRGSVSCEIRTAVPLRLSVTGRKPRLINAGLSQVAEQ